MVEIIIILNFLIGHYNVAKLSGTLNLNLYCDFKLTVSGKGEPIDKQIKTSKCEESVIPKKSLVTMYNHATRDIRDIPYGDEKLVVRNLQESDDAYSQAMKESTASHVSAKDSHKKVQEIRSKVAVAKQNVEKEYRDTISFLNSLPKDKGNKPIVCCFKIQD